MGVDQEPLLEETLHSKKMKESIDELEETLSLCDLPLYSDQSVDYWDQEFSPTSNSTSSSIEDYFEFFSQELRPSAAAFPPENIIFCGKLIPYKQLPPCKKPAGSSNQADTIKIQTNHTKKSSWRFKNGNKSTTKKMYNTNKLGNRRKVKWYFFLFGIPRFSPVVELTDIRSRQGRRRCRSPPHPSLPPMFGFPNGDHDEVISDRRWGLWGLIRALSCGGNHQPSAMATVAAGGGFPPE